MLSRTVEMAACVDQLNLPSLLSFEFILRRLQVIEEAHVLSPSMPSYDAAEHRMGEQHKKGAVLVFPKLAKQVATRVKAETELAKEKRLSREEKKLIGKKSGKGDKGTGRGDAEAAAS